MLNTGRFWVKEDIVVEPLAATVSREAPDDEATLKGFKVPVPWMLKETVEDVAPTPATVPLSSSAPAVKVFGEVQMAS